MSAAFRIRLGSRTFAPSWGMTLLTLALMLAFGALGRWQWQKGNLRELQSEAFARGTERAEPLGTRTLADVQRFHRISVTGRFDPAHQFLLDNRTRDGRAGYEVLTPLVRGDRPMILVNRGWVPFSGFREKLPDVSLPGEASVEVVGRVDELPSEGLQSGRAPPAASAPWPKVTSYPHAAELIALLGRPAEGRILLLDAGQPNGYLRDWQPPGLPAIRHWSYGVQWFAFALLAMVLWVILGMRQDR